MSGKVGHAGSVNDCDFVRVGGRYSEELVRNAAILRFVFRAIHRASVWVVG